MSLSNMDVPFRLRLSMCLFVALLAAGCNRGVVYKPSTLPAEFLAPQLSNMNRVNLSRVAQSPGDTEMLYPGDVVSITVATGLETEKPNEFKGRIAEDGTVNIPLIGVVPIAGLRLPFAEQIIHDEAVNRGKFVNPNVTLLIVTRRSNNVTVVGEVTKPGTYALPVTNSNILAAITAAEGMTKEADSIIEVQHASSGQGMAGPQNDPRNPGNMELAGFRRNQGAQGMPIQSVRIDLEQPQLNPSMLQVGDGSTVMVMKRPKRYVHVIGLVRRPDQIEMPQDQELRLLDAIAMANGRTLELADKVRVIRNIPNRPEPVIIEASVRDAKRNASSNFRLAPGDVVSVEETPTTLVVGTVREFIRFGFTAGIPGL